MWHLRLSQPKFDSPVCNCHRNSQQNDCAHIDSQSQNGRQDRQDQGLAWILPNGTLPEQWWHSGNVAVFGSLAWQTSAVAALTTSQTSLWVCKTDISPKSQIPNSWSVNQFIMYFALSISTVRLNKGFRQQ